MQRQPIVYLTEKFLKSLLIHFSTRFRDLKVQKSVLVFLEKLIEKSYLYIDLDEKEIRELLAKPEADIQLMDDAQRRYQTYFVALSKINRIKSCKKEIEIFHSLQYDEFDKLQAKPNFVFLSTSKDYCKQIEKEFGVICISTDLQLDEKNAGVVVKSIKAATKTEIEYNISFPVSHSIVIEDKYLFENDSDGKFLEKLLLRLVSNRIKVNVSVSILSLGSGDFRKTIRNIKRNLNITIEHHQVKNDHMHDRVIYSNSFYMVCGYGFQGVYPKLTEWIILPIGIYFDHFVERRKVTSDIIQNKINNTTSNYLLK
jgi:hypothetical protein